MEKGFLPDRDGLESIKRRLSSELKREFPQSLEERLDGILRAALNFHPHDKPVSEAPTFDFRSLTGESLLPSRDDSFGAADFLKLSQVFERSLVGLISASDLPADDKSRFVNDIQEFFDGFDTVLLGQLEEELITRGLLRPALAPEPEPLESLIGKLGFSKELVDEMSDPVIVAAGNRIIYANQAAASALGGDVINKPCSGPDGLFGEFALPESRTPGEWSRRIVRIVGAEVLAAWKAAATSDGPAYLIVFPGSAKPVDPRRRVDVLTREGRRFKVLYRLSRELQRGADVEGLLARLSKELSAAVQYDALFLHLHHDHDRRAMFHLAAPVPEEILDALLENSITILTAFIPGFDKSNIRRVILNPKLAGAGFKGKPPGGLFILPLTFKDEIFGTLGIYRMSDYPVSDDDLHLFSTFCNQLALALKNMVAVDGMRRMLRDGREQIELARRVQMGLLPEPEAFRRLRFRTLFYPAAGLSGDFYHYFVNADAEGLVIGDVSGHGISASLIMAAAGATFREACAEPGCEPDEVLLKANAALKKALGDDFFVVAFIFAVNPQTLRARYATAGHPGPFLLKPDGGLRLLTASGLPLGMFESPLPYKVHSLQLKPGDRMLFFTDGAIENRNERGEIYGPKRLRKSLKRALHLPGDELLASVVEDIAGFLGGSYRPDDLTLILMEVD